MLVQEKGKDERQITILCKTNTRNEKYKIEVEIEKKILFIHKYFYI